MGCLPEERNTMSSRGAQYDVFPRSAATRDLLKHTRFASAEQMVASTGERNTYLYVIVIGVGNDHWFGTAAAAHTR
jgi:hypothetical protein